LQYETDRDFILDYEYFPSLIKHSEFVLGGLTSMLIEASIFGKSYLALAYKEKFNLTSPYNVYNSYTHFENIDRLPNLEFCHSIEDLKLQFLKMFRSTPPNQNEIDIQLNYFYDLSEENFSEKIMRLIDKILLLQSRELT
jgi:hypothetical protein